MARTVFAESVTPAFFVPPSTVAVTYQGPGDLPGLSTSLAWYGLRGFDAAHSTGSTNCLDLLDQSSANPITIKILSNGRLDVLSITNWVSAHSVTSIQVNKWYDQSGHGLDLLPAFNIPKLVLNVLSGYPVVRISVSDITAFFNTPGITQSQPFLISWVASRDGAGANDFLLSSASNSLDSGYASAANRTLMYAGNVVTGVATDGVFHAVQQNFNGSGTSDQMIDGVQTTGLNPDINGFSGDMLVGSDSLSPHFTGNVAELGVWAGNQSANEAALNSNQHGTNGYNF